MIHKTLQQLYKDKSIVIKPADKNLGLVIMNKSDYITMCMKHLNDRKVYLIVNFYNPERHFAGLRQLLKKHDKLHITINNVTHLTKLATSLLQLQIFKDKTLRIAPFYSLPKIHKIENPSPGRPLCSSPSTLTYHCSLYLDKVLQPLLIRIPTICTSSSSVIQDLHQLRKVPINSIILCADIKSLYPNIPIHAGIHAVREVCRDFKHHLDELDFICELLEFVLLHNFCTFNEIIYLQIQGTAMGTPLAVAYANIFLYHLERTILTDCHHIYYRRFIDDIFAIMPPASAQQFVTIFNTQHSTITLEQITMNKTGIFLDLQIELIPDPNDINFVNIKHTVYQKPINIYQYIPYMSAHKPHVLYNFILNEFKRYVLLCSHVKDSNITASAFTQRLKDRGYPSHIISKARSAVPPRDSLLANLNRHKHIPIHRTPFATIDLPRLYPQPNWKSLFSITSLSEYAEYKKTYGINDVMIAFKSPPNIGKIITRSTFIA